METQHQFVHVMQYAMDKDGDNETRPMTYEPSSPSEISDLLDVISYSKGIHLRKKVKFYKFLTNISFI